MKHERVDKIGAVASFACAIHCVLMPLVITLLPLIGLAFLSSEWVEWGLFGLSAGFGITSLCWGYKKHRNRTGLKILALGLALIATGRVADNVAATTHLRAFAPWILLVGGLLVAISHGANLMLCRNCHGCNVSSSRKTIQ